ncbi:MAG TPA: hypothetical protein VF221_00655, partial [Chloroflexota bacterium]
GNDERTERRHGIGHDVDGRRIGWWIPRLAGAVAAVAILFALVLRPWQANVTPANAYDLLRAAAQASASQFPYTGTSEVSWLDLPEYTLPDSAAKVAGQHRALVHWEVQNATHFRVDIRTVLPALDAGRETVVVDGGKIYRYDARTETAAVGTLYPFARKSFGPQLLPYLRTGGEYGQAPEPDPSQSIQGYLAQQESARAKVHGYARIVGHGVLLGRKVDIVQFAPLVVYCDKSLQNNTCAVPMQGFGVGKAWIDHDHPFILRYRESGFGGLHSLHTQRLHFDYRVTSVHYGTAPRVSRLVFHAPVPIRNAGHWTVGSFAGNDLPNNGQFIYAPAPSRYTHLDWVQPAGMAGGQEIGPLPVVTKASMLYSVHGRHIITYLHKGDRYGFGLYVTGPYLYVQERIQVHGMPAVLKTGTLRTVGTCRMWIDNTVGGGHRVTFQHGLTSVLVVSNALTSHDLLQYAYRELCSAHW